MARAPDVAVVGAGVFGLSTALRLAWSGLAVRVLDERRFGTPNASAVAAGMLAPVSETLAEGGDHAHLARLIDARDLWPAFAGGVPGLALHRAGSDLLASDAPEQERVVARLSAWGMDFSPLPPPRLGVHVPDDWRLDAPKALAAMRAALRELGVKVAASQVSPAPSGDGLLADGEPLQAGIIVIAAGYGARALAPAAPELVQLRPIKGQLAVFASGGEGGPSLNDRALYVVPQASGARAGATMQMGIDDEIIDPATLARHAAAARHLAPSLASLGVRGEAGVRAATPDGWPLVGPSASPGIFLATAARRNGWLLAPLVSQMILGAVMGAEPHPLAQAFHPGRFTR